MYSVDNRFKFNTDYYIGKGTVVKFSKINKFNAEVEIVVNGHIDARRLLTLTKDDVKINGKTQHSLSGILAKDDFMVRYSRTINMLCELYILDLCGTSYISTMKYLDDRADQNFEEYQTYDPEFDCSYETYMAYYDRSLINYLDIYIKLSMAK